MQELRKLQEKMFEDMITGAHAPEYLKHAERLEVYGTGYLIRIDECMTADYPITLWTLGKEAFNNLVREYIQMYPPRKQNINLLSLDLPHFVEKKNDAQHPWLLDLVSYEANLIHSQRKPLLPAMDMESLRDVPLEEWTNALFSFQPHMILQFSNWAVQRLDDAHKNNIPYSPDLLIQQATPLIIHQTPDGVFRAVLEEDEFQALKLLSSGHTLGSTIENMQKENIEQSIFSWFQQWHGIELITKIEFPNHER